MRFGPFRAPWLSLLLASALLSACAADADSSGDDPEAGLEIDEVGSFDDSKADLGSITWIRPEAPEAFVMGETHVASLAYRQCYQTEPAEGVDIAIQCDPATCEVAWYVVPAADIEAAIAEGLTSLVLTFASPVAEEQTLVRATVRREDGEGNSTRLAASAQLFDGDTLTAALDEATDLHVFIGKGRVIGPWDTGTVDFLVTPTFE